MGACVEPNALARRLKRLVGKHVQVAVDGAVPTNISLQSAKNVSAATVWEWEEGADDHGRKGLPHGHALLVRGETGSEAWLEFLPPTLSDTLSGAVSAEY